LVHLKNLFAPKLLKVNFYSNDKGVVSPIVMQLVWFYMHDTILNYCHSLFVFTLSCFCLKNGFEVDHDFKDCSKFEWS
jgi:hypothetical protein